MYALVRYLLARAKEPSTAAGAAMLLTALHMNVPADFVTAAFQAVVGVLGLVAVVMKERGAQPLPGIADPGVKTPPAP